MVSTLAAAYHPGCHPFKRGLRKVRLSKAPTKASIDSLLATRVPRSRDCRVQSAPVVLGFVVLLLFMVLAALSPVAGACALKSHILCLELPVPGDPWAVELSAPWVALTTWVDFLFLVAYTAWLIALIRLVSFGPTALALSGLAVLAGALDAVENSLILAALENPDGYFQPWVYFFASTKFTFLALVLVGVSANWGQAPLDRLRQLVAGVGLIAFVSMNTLREAVWLGALTLPLVMGSLWWSAIRLARTDRKVPL